MGVASRSSAAIFGRKLGTDLVDRAGRARRPHLARGTGITTRDKEMAITPSPAREAVRAVVPRMIELSETVIYGDIWERQQVPPTVQKLAKPNALMFFHIPLYVLSHNPQGSVLVDPSSQSRILRNAGHRPANRATPRLWHF